MDMQVLAQMDLLPRSYSVEHTMTSMGSQLPYRCQAVGQFWAGEDYYTRRAEFPTCFVGYCLEGAGMLSYHGGQFRIFPQSVFFISCMEPHAYETLQAPWRFRWMHVSGTGCDTVFHIFSQQCNFCCAVEGTAMDDSFDRMEQMMACYSLQADVRIAECVSGILCRLCDAQLSRQQAGAMSMTNPDVITAARYIQLHFNEKIEVSDLAAMAHMSSYHFIRQFRQATGCTPYQYVLRMRLEEARTQLKTTNRPVSEIAELVGYSDASALSREFRRHTGMTPGHYRLMERTN